jgi:decaprenylphospho-beta-D-erythro-pentofuranosid-2-ulose 2-reductase
VKPGPVDTPMTQGLDRRPLLISADEAAKRILRAARRRAVTAYIPGSWRPIMFALRHIPSLVFSRLDV